MAEVNIYRLGPSENRVVPVKCRRDKVGEHLVSPRPEPVYTVSLFDRLTCDLVAKFVCRGLRLARIAKTSCTRLSYKSAGSGIQESLTVPPSHDMQESVLQFFCRDNTLGR